MRAYNEIYLDDAMRNLANAFDYAVNSCNMDIDLFGEFFIASEFDKEFGKGNPRLVSGMSGVELVRSIYYKIYKEDILPDPIYNFDRTKEYWLGFTLAYYQWYSGRRFKDIIEIVPLSNMLQMYPEYHEMDIMRFVEVMEERLNDRRLPTKLKKIRESRGFSQSELSRKSGVTLRAIQLYEQKVNNIDKASVNTIYKLAKVLYCEIEDLLENPGV
jgi:DNA-binding XRE family transcriptional regulator